MSAAALTWPRLVAVMAALCAIEALAAALALSVGSSEALSASALFEALTGERELSQAQWTILTLARGKRAAMAAAVGAALASAGVMFQALLRNPLADPYILGVSGGGALAATLYLALGASLGSIGSIGAEAIALGVPGAAMVGSLLTIAALLFATRVMRPAGSSRQSAYALLLLGVVFNAFASSCITLIKALVSAEKAQQLLFYLMGSLSVEGLSWTMIALIALTVVGCVAAMTHHANELNALALGEEAALGLGVLVDRVQRLGVVIASIAVAVAVAYTGLIGFVGLVVPHGLRLVIGSDHRVLIPASALGGAAALTLSDVLARGAFGVFDMTLPVGAVTALLGAPLFAALLGRAVKAKAL